jgi:hypothetical protein
MHPLAAIGLVILTGLAWLGTIMTLLVSLESARRRRSLEEAQKRVVNTHDMAGTQCESDS